MASQQEPTREELIAEIRALRATIAELREREYRRIQTEHELRREVRLMAESARTTGNILRSTVALTQHSSGELEQARRQAEQAALAKTRFLANISHELRTPMTAILGFTEALLDETDRPFGTSRMDHLQRIQRNGRHLLRVLNDLLDFSRIEAGAIQAERSWVSPFEIVQDVESVLHDAALAKGIGLELGQTGPVPAQIHVDPTRVRQILIHLVENAIKFTDAGSVRVRLRLEPEGGEGERILSLSVCDTGRGMTPLELSSLFDPLGKADSDAERARGGTGLGLALSKRLAELLGGKLTANSAPGSGSEFTLSVPVGHLQAIPLVTNPDQQGIGPAFAFDEHHETTRSFIRGVREHGPSARVLLVEDGEDNRRLLSLTLKKAGFELSLAENGQQGVELALAATEAGQPFDVILMDIRMPVLDGYEATSRLREAGVEQPIVALTAHGDRERCLEVGCNAFVAKPVRRRELVQLILDLLAKSDAAA